MELGKSVCSVFLDVRKAFDSVPHTILVNKLHGLNVYLLRWICDYLSDREQCVVLNGVTSRPQPVPSGVPQGSVLGPIMFTLYINNLADLQLSESTVQIGTLHMQTIYYCANQLKVQYVAQSQMLFEHQGRQSRLISCSLANHQLL